MKTVFVVFELVDAPHDNLLCFRTRRDKAMNFAADHKPAVILEMTLVDEQIVNRWELS